MLQMKDRREEDKNAFINAGLMNDPYKAVSLKDAITMVGTCMDMCPELERHEREFQNNVDKWEAVRQLATARIGLPHTLRKIDPDAKPRRIDHVRAVKAFQRATQGTEPIPSDLRPLPVLQVCETTTEHRSASSRTIALANGRLSLSHFAW